MKHEDYIAYDIVYDIVYNIAYDVYYVYRIRCRV